MTLFVKYILGATVVIAFELAVLMLVILFGGSSSDEIQIPIPPAITHEPTPFCGMIVDQYDIGHWWCPYPGVLATVIR
jgi:hypothetical protein